MYKPVAVFPLLWIPNSKTLKHLWYQQLYVHDGSPQRNLSVQSNVWVCTGVRLAAHTQQQLEQELGAKLVNHYGPQQSAPLPAVGVFTP